MNLDFPNINGWAVSFADINVKCALSKGPLFVVGDLKSIDTGTTIDRGEQRSGGRVIRRTTGSISNTASMTMYRSGFNLFLANLGASTTTRRADKAVIGSVTFDIQVSHSLPDDPEIYEFTLVGCRVAGWTMNGAEGPDADTVDVPLSVLEIVYGANGNNIVLL